MALRMAASTLSGEVPTISVTRYVRSDIGASLGGQLVIVLPTPPIRHAARAGKLAGVFSSDADHRRLEERAREVLDEAVFDFYAGGAGDESTLAANVAAWGRVRLRPRVLRDVSRVDTGVTVLGRRLPGPVCVAPVGYQVLAHPDGEL